MKFSDKRTKRHMPGAMALCAILFVCIISGCTGTGNVAGNGAQQTVKVSGAFALYPMMVKWAEEYNKLHPEIRIDVSAGGAGKGMTDTISGMVDLGMISREIHPEEIEKGIVFVPVTKDAVIPIINSKNPVIGSLLSTGVKKEGFIGIWITGETKTWGQLSGTGQNDKINVYTRSDACGASDTWAAYLGGKKQEDLLGVQVYGDPGIADAVKRDTKGIGYNNLNYAYDSNTGRPVDGIAVVPIDINGNGKLDSEENLYGTRDEVAAAIANGVYPSPPARDLYLVAKDSFKGAAGDFVKWVLTDGQKYVPEAGYINLPQQKINDALEKI